MQYATNCQYLFANCAVNNDSTEELQQYQDQQKQQHFGFQEEYLSESTNVFEQQLNLFEDYVNEQLFSGKINVKSIPDKTQQILDQIQPKIEEKPYEQEWKNESNVIGFNQSVFQNNFFNTNQQNQLITTFQNNQDNNFIGNNFQIQVSQFNFQNDNFFLSDCPQPKFENPSFIYQENQFLNLPISQQSNLQNQQTQCDQQIPQYQQTQQYQQQQEQAQNIHQYQQQDQHQNKIIEQNTFNVYPNQPKQPINNAIFETKLENSDDEQESEQNSQEKPSTTQQNIHKTSQSKKYLFDNNSNKLKNFYKTLLKPLIENLKKVYKQQNRDDVVEFIKMAFPISCNQKHFLLLFPHLQEISNMQKKTTVVQEFEQKLNFNQEQLQILSEIRKQAARLFSNKFYYFTRIFKSHAASKNIEEFYYGCLFYSERQNQEQYTPEGSIYVKPERKLNPVQSNLRQRLYQIQSNKLQQQYSQKQNIQQIQQRVLFY
ncbi:hypothetical protein TTHERM_00129440 (macronuclear) [Tetrahymena thermophila SB210]|uniref:Uncharacterized protein n=1 Tax=Tetrahymena thermophila (strain SB210) TaxID=312017 RepID=I7M7X1_TETTS|nr:hypothetical protein TTHERM_00129440 [Tetrahymena thermophila SB210]EAR96168.1 hypothetical protein TTHERM_00129440 [Tetrahymena thermophila SB210]|eukprot:XP_001016413.1 hypothetical protein TTHERM_00129440 [Tetrahymena thermophila SB210]